MTLVFWEEQVKSKRSFFQERPICSAKSKFLIQPAQTNTRYQAVSGFPSDTLGDNETAQREQ